MKLRQRGNPNKNQKDYICNTPVRPKKKGGGGGGGKFFLVPTCLPTTPPNPSSPTTSHNSLFSLFGLSLSFLFPFSFSFSINTTHIHTLLSLTLPPVHSLSSPLPFFWQNHWKILKNITPSHKLFEVKVLISLNKKKPKEI